MNVHDDCKVGIESKEIHHLICTPECSRTVSCVKICFLFLAFILFFILGILYSEFYYRRAVHSITHSGSKENAILPRQTATLTDLGYSTRFRDWVDVQNQGVCNDYARYVGPNEKHPFTWFSIALAGSTEQYTQPGLYEEHSGIVKRTLIKPRQIIPDIDKLGLPNHFKGWVDVQNQGIANDYAYYVPATEDIPFAWLTIALAGSSKQRTCVGLYVEKYGIVRPTLEERYYKKGIDINCQHMESKIRDFFLASSKYNLYNYNSFLYHSISDIQQAIAENLPNEDSPNTTSVMVSKQHPPRDNYTFIELDFRYSNSASTTFSLAFLIAMMAFIAFNHVF